MVLPFVAFMQMPLIAAAQEVLTTLCISQTELNSTADLETLIKRPVGELNLSEDEKIDGVVISKNQKFVALDVYSVRNAKTSRIVVLSLSDGHVKSYDVKLDPENEKWVSAVGAVGDSGKFIMARVANPDGDKIKYRWRVVRLDDFTVVEEGMDRMLEKWDSREK